MNQNKHPKVFVIVLNYNGGELLRGCLRSVFQLDYPNFEVVLVDNASTDGSLEMAKESFSRAHIIRSDQNRGFSAGNNLGIRFALEKMTDFVFLLNPDALMEKNTLTHLIETAENNPQAGILSPVIFQDQSEKIWFAGGRIEWSKMRATHLQKITSENHYQSEYLSGCAMLVRKDVFKKIGLLDEDYFLYYEDTDFSFRASQSGFQLLVVPKTKVFHFEKSENNLAFKTYWLVFSGLLFFNKNATTFTKIWLKFYLLGRKMKNWRELRKGGHPLAETVKRAYNDYTQWKRNHPASHS